MSIEQYLNNSMSFRLSSLTQSQDQRIAQLQLRIQALPIHRDDVHTMDLKKSELAARLITLENDKVELMRRLEHQLQTKQMELAQLRAEKSVCMGETTQLIGERGRLEEEIENYQRTMHESEQKLREMRSNEHRLRDQKERILKEERVLNQQDTKLREELNRYQYQGSKLLSKHHQLEMRLNEELEQIMVEEERSEAIKEQLIINIDEYKGLLDQIQRIELEMVKSEKRLEKEEMESRVMVKESETRETRSLQLVNGLGLKNEEWNSSSRVNRQLKQRRSVVMGSTSAKSSELGLLRSGNERLMREEGELKCSVEKKEIMVRLLGARVEQMNGNNRVIRMQLEGMRMDDVNVKSILDMKWKELGTQSEQRVRSESMRRTQSSLKELSLNSLHKEMFGTADTGLYFKEL